MNVKKYLKQEAQRSLRALETDRDREFLRRMQDTVTERPGFKRRLQWLWAIPSAAVCTVAAVLIGVFVPFGNKVEYNDNNFVNCNSSYAELSGALKHMKVHIAEDTYTQRTYDSVSGDDIYYTIAVDYHTETYAYQFEARIVVTKRYKFKDFVLTDGASTQKYSGYTVSYEQYKEEVDPESGLNIMQCKGKIEHKKYDIYITSFKEFTTGENTFLTILNNTFEFI